MRTHSQRLTVTALAAAVAVLAAPALTRATDYEASDYLPLVVGNSWTFVHVFYDFYEHQYSPGKWPAYERVTADSAAYLTITVERTEVIDHQTYYVLSDMPSGWPPQPPHCLAGKKLRWKGSELMERRASGERSILRFEGPSSTYAIPTTEGDDEVQRFRKATSAGVPEYEFLFHGYGFDWLPEIEGGGEWPTWRVVRFLAGYGLDHCSESVAGPDYGVFDNLLIPIGAVLVEARTGGATGQSSTTRSVSHDAARRGEVPSSVAPTSWGRAKGEN